jgi:nicotinamidase-related amidase
MAVLVLDVITDLAFPDGGALLRPAQRAAAGIVRLTQRARKRGVPVIYVNDDFGMFRADLNALLERCLHPGSLGRPIVEMVRPQRGDRFLLKPKHSAFFGTSLHTLLDRMGARRLVLVGFSAHQCVLFTATDAHVREHSLIVPRDCVASPQRAQTSFALRYLAEVLQADTRPSASLRLGRR